MNKKKEWKYLFLIVVIFIAACIETDIYLPAFPDMMMAFNASEGEIQSLLTWNFAGICLSGPLYGPLSDAFGRKKPLLLALFLFLLGSIITLFAPTLGQMLAGRLLQGLGSGGCFTLGTAIIFDAFQKEKAIQALNRLNMIIPVLMSVAPMVGAYLNHIYGFRSNFLLIALFVLISLFVCLLFFEETHPKEKQTPFKINSVLQDFKEALFNGSFWQLTLTSSLLFAGYIAFLSGTAVLFVIDFHMSKTVFPFFQASLLLAWIIGGFALKPALNKWGPLPVKKAGLGLSLVGAFSFAIASYFSPQDAYLLTSGMLLYAFGANWMIGLYFPEAMEILPHIKGVTASLLTSVRLLISALIVGASGLIYNGTIYPIVAIVLGSAVLILPMVLSYERKNYLKQTSI